MATNDDDDDDDDADNDDDDDDDAMEDDFTERVGTDDQRMYKTTGQAMERP